MVEGGGATLYETALSLKVTGELHTTVEWIGTAVGSSTPLAAAHSLAGMAQLNVSLSEDLSRWAESRAAEARMGGAGDYVAELVRRDRDEAEKLARLRAAIDEGLASPVVNTTIDEIIARGRARHGIE